MYDQFPPFGIHKGLLPAINIIMCCHSSNSCAMTSFQHTEGKYNIVVNVLLASKMIVIVLVQVVSYRLCASKHKQLLLRY